MSTARVDRPSDRSAPPTAAIVGADPLARRRVVAILRTHGFDVGKTPSPGADSVLVVLTSGGDADRVRGVRAAVDAARSAKVLAVVAAGVRNASLRRVLLAGADGMLLDSDLDRALVASLHAVLAGQLVVPTALARQLAPRPLSHREKQILSLVVLGLTNREIGGKLFLAESTVKTHLSSAFRKLDARSRADAVARILDPEDGRGAGVLEIGDAVGADAA